MSNNSDHFGYILFASDQCELLYKDQKGKGFMHEWGFIMQDVAEKVMLGIFLCPFIILLPIFYHVLRWLSLYNAWFDKCMCEVS